MIAEGLLIYLTPDDVGGLARDLAAQPSFVRWITDLSSPALLTLPQKNMAALPQAGSPLEFAPAAGPAFFEPFGWKPLSVHSLFHNAARLRRLPLLLRLLAMVFPSEIPNPRRPWSGIVLLGKG